MVMVHMLATVNELTQYVTLLNGQYNNFLNFKTQLQSFDYINLQVAYIVTHKLKDLICFLIFSQKILWQLTEVSFHTSHLSILAVQDSLLSVERS